MPPAAAAAMSGDGPERLGGRSPHLPSVAETGVVVDVLVLVSMHPVVAGRTTRANGAA